MDKFRKLHLKHQENEVFRQQRDKARAQAARLRKELEELKSAAVEKPIPALIEIPVPVPVPAESPASL